MVNIPLFTGLKIHPRWLFGIYSINSIIYKSSDNFKEKLVILSFQILFKDGTLAVVNKAPFHSTSRGEITSVTRV